MLTAVAVALKAALLHAIRCDVVVKTTGCEAMMIHARRDRSAREIFDAAAAIHPSLAGLSHDAIGALGRPIRIEGALGADPLLAVDEGEGVGALLGHEVRQPAPARGALVLRDGRHAAALVGQGNAVGGSCVAAGVKAGDRIAHGVPFAVVHDDYHN